MHFSLSMLVEDGPEEAVDKHSRSKLSTRSVPSKPGLTDHADLPLDLVMGDPISAASSEEGNDAIIVQDSENLRWYQVQYPDYTVMRNESEGSEGYSEQERHEDVFLQHPLPASLSDLLSTVPPNHMLPKALRGFSESFIQKIILSYPLTFHPGAVWQARALSSGKTIIQDLHSLKADGFCLSCVDLHSMNLSLLLLVFLTDSLAASRLLVPSNLTNPSISRQEIP